MTTEIKCNKDLYNMGKCFTKGHTYTIENRDVHNEASLIDMQTINDQKQPHIIGQWWRHFKIVNQF